MRHKIVECDDSKREDDESTMSLRGVWTTSLFLLSAAVACIVCMHVGWLAQRITRRVRR